MVWDLKGTENQNSIIQAALDRCTFPFQLLVPGLRAQQNKETIPVEWADLTSYGARGHGDVDAHVLEYREKVLGLAWYSGKISMDISLENNHTLAHEVFLSEGAHMIDFFYMSDEQRDAIWRAYHGGITVEHNHGWFDVGSYGDWAGESFMNTFCLAYSDIIPQIDFFTHKSTPEVVVATREALTPEPEEPANKQNFFRSNRSKVVHDTHAKISQDVWYSTLAEALTNGCRPCKVCRPKEV